MHKNTLLALLLSFTFLGFGQKIDRSKDELKNKNTTSTTTTSTSTSQSSSRNSSNDFGIGGFFVELFFYIGFYTTVGDYRSENHLYNSLTPYPYSEGKSGNFQTYEDVKDIKNRMRIDIDNQFMMSNSENYGNHLKVKFRPFQYFYLQTDYRALFEKNKFTNEVSNLSLYHFNFGYDRIRFEKFNLGWTLGASYIASDVNKAGFSYGLNAEAFPAKNISFNSSLLWSKINQLPVNAFELKAKYHRKNYFFTAGYEHLKIATPTYNFATVGAGIYF